MRPMEKRKHFAKSVSWVKPLSFTLVYTINSGQLYHNNHPHKDYHRHNSQITLSRETVSYLIFSQLPDVPVAVNVCCDWMHGELRRLMGSHCSLLDT